MFGEVAFDSLKPVAARIGRRRSEKACTDETTRFAAYYGFSVNACNPARGNEKGHVGNSGKNARAELFSTVCEFAAREGMEAHRDRAMAGCNRRSAAGFAKERPALRPLPGSRYVVARFGEAKANKYSLISVMSNFCSVPEGLAGERVEWEAINGELVVLDRGAVVARHRLLDGKGRYSVEIRHCLETLRRKPGALARSLALRQGDEGLAAAYEVRHKGDPSGFIDFLSEASEPTDRGKRIAEASIAQLRRIGENVTARRRRWISRGWPRPLG